MLSVVLGDRCILSEGSLPSSSYSKCTSTVKHEIQCGLVSEDASLRLPDLRRRCTLSCVECGLERVESCFQIMQHRTPPHRS